MFCWRIVRPLDQSVLINPATGPGRSAYDAWRRGFGSSDLAAVNASSGLV